MSPCRRSRRRCAPSRRAPTLVEAQRIRLVNKLAVLVGSNPGEPTIGKEPFARPFPAIPGRAAVRTCCSGVPTSPRPNVISWPTMPGSASPWRPTSFRPSNSLRRSASREFLPVDPTAQPDQQHLGASASACFHTLFNSGRTTPQCRALPATYEEQGGALPGAAAEILLEVETALAGLRRRPAGTPPADCRGQRGSTATLASQRFQQGLVSMLDVLTAQRAVLTSRTVARPDHQRSVDDDGRPRQGARRRLAGSRRCPRVRRMWAPPLKQ